MGEAWVFPSSSSRANERDVGCECFDPDGEVFFVVVVVVLLNVGAIGVCMYVCMSCADDKGDDNSAMLHGTRLLLVGGPGSLLHAERIHVLRRHVLRGRRVVLCWGVLLSRRTSVFSFPSLPPSSFNPS